MTGICVIGLGSPHGDDRIGWELVRLLESEHGLDGSLRLRACATVGAELLEFWKGAELAVIVDAVRSAGLPGTVRRIVLHPQRDQSMPDALRALSSHGIDLPELIELGEALGILPRRLLLFGMEVGACAPFEPLSVPVRAALPGLAQAVHAEIAAAVGKCRID
jgi:hydrogenase maturation protease